MSEAAKRYEEKRIQVGNAMKWCIAGAFCLLVPPVGILLILIGFSKLKDAERDMKSLYKDAFVREPLARNFEQVVYEPTKGFSLPTVLSFQLCKQGDIFDSEDYIRAVHRGVMFEEAQVWLRGNEVKVGNSSQPTTFFKGRIMVFNFPSKIVSSVTVYDRNFEHRFLGKKEAKDLKVEMESVGFNNSFDVYSLAPHDAFYLLTPHVMERLQAMAGKVESIAMRVVGNCVILALHEPDNDAFDAKVNIGKVVYEQEIAKVQGDIDDIKMFIDVLLG